MSPTDAAPDATAGEPAPATAEPEQATTGEPAPATAKAEQPATGKPTPAEQPTSSDPTGEPTAGGPKPGAPEAAAEQPGAAGAGGPGGRVRRVLRPGRIRPAAVGRAVVGWAKRPSGRVILPGALAVVLIAGAGVAGAYLVPETLDAMPASSAPPSFAAPVGPAGNGVPGPAQAAGSPTGPSGPAAPAWPAGPSGAGPAVPPAPAGPGARPADALVGWAQPVGVRVGIPVVALQAYGYAELVLSRTVPSCRLSWTTLAAIAKVESAHGSANGAVLGVNGEALPAIVGLPLDGKGDRQLIKDTDGGALDGDAVFDRAMGPLQFIPTTWRENAVDADNNGLTDPNDIDDAALAAGMYLCRNGRNMAKADDWWSAILSYNNVRPYAQQVFTEANAYGQQSRT